MTLRSIAGGIRRRTFTTIGRRDFTPPNTPTVVSFTFDDFPRSAWEIGGAILQNYGASGTYYAAMGLMNTVNHLGPHFCADDLPALLSAGHELGSHTYGHLSCRTSSVRDFRADLLKGKEAVERVTGGCDSHQFSYPYGHVALRTKKAIGECFTSCRGITPGVNRWPADLNLLYANSLYSGSFDLDSIRGLLRDAGETGGWVIFYTHDISEKPSAFGCKPHEFESVVKLAVRSSARIVRVGNVICGEGGRFVGSLPEDEGRKVRVDI